MEDIIEEISKLTLSSSENRKKISSIFQGYNKFISSYYDIMTGTAKLNREKRVEVKISDEHTIWLKPGRDGVKMTWKKSFDKEEPFTHSDFINMLRISQKKVTEFENDLGNLADRWESLHQTSLKLSTELKALRTLEQRAEVIDQAERDFKDSFVRQEDEISDLKHKMKVKHTRSKKELQQVKDSCKTRIIIVSIMAVLSTGMLLKVGYEVAGRIGVSGFIELFLA